MQITALRKCEQTDEFAKWLKRLKNAAAQARILVRIQRLSLTQNFEDTEPIGNGVFEKRIDYGPCYRLHYSPRGKELALLLIGGDRPSQQKEISKTKKLNQKYKW